MTTTETEGCWCGFPDSANVDHGPDDCMVIDGYHGGMPLAPGLSANVVRAHPTPEEHPVTDPTERPLVEAYGQRDKSGYLWTGQHDVRMTDVPLIAADRLTDPALVTAVMYEVYAREGRERNVGPVLAALRAHLEGL